MPATLLAAAALAAPVLSAMGPDVAADGPSNAAGSDEWPGNDDQGAGLAAGHHGPPPWAR